MLANRINRAQLIPGRHVRVTGLDQVDKVVGVDQSPIGRTPRSNPATYTGVFDHVRKLFTSTSEAKVRGYQAGRFSFNVKGGRCEACAGDGTLKIEMNFLPDIYVPCEVCKGARFNRETLEVHYKGKNIAEVLNMTIEEAAVFFEAIGPIHRHLKTLVEVGLGYVRLGQPATTLSGGEAQRVKLASELQKRSTGRTVYVLDEPTTGLHFADVEKLLGVIQGLVDKGNTVIVIEHNLDVIKTADWIIDMGPEGGSGGGRVMAEGTPETIASTVGSHTGTFLRPVLRGREPSAAGRKTVVKPTRKAEVADRGQGRPAGPGRRRPGSPDPGPGRAERAVRRTARLALQPGPGLPSSVPATSAAAPAGGTVRSADVASPPGVLSGVPPPAGRHRQAHRPTRRHHVGSGRQDAAGVRSGRIAPREDLRLPVRRAPRPGGHPAGRTPAPSPRSTPASTPRARSSSRRPARSGWPPSTRATTPSRWRSPSSSTGPRSIMVGRGITLEQVYRHL